MLSILTRTCSSLIWNNRWTENQELSKRKYVRKAGPAHSQIDLQRGCLTHHAPSASIIQRRKRDLAQPAVQHCRSEEAALEGGMCVCHEFKLMLMLRVAGQSEGVKDLAPLAKSAFPNSSHGWSLVAAQCDGKKSCSSCDFSCYFSFHPFVCLFSGRGCGCELVDTMPNHGLTIPLIPSSLALALTYD